MAYGTNRTVKVLFRPHKIFCRNRLILGLGKCVDPEFWTDSGPPRPELPLCYTGSRREGSTFLVSQLLLHVAGVALTAHFEKEEVGRRGARLGLVISLNLCSTDGTMLVDGVEINDDDMIKRCSDEPEDDIEECKLRGER